MIIYPAFGGIGNFLKLALYSDLPVYKSTYDLLIGIFQFTKDFGKEYKYTIGESLKKETIDLLTLIYRANIKKDKQEVIQEARERIEVIRLFIRVMKDLRQISLKQFVQVNELVEQVSKQLAGWQLTLHPNKMYLQHYCRGVKFLGTFIKPSRIYIANRTKGNFFNAIQKQNHIIMNQALRQEELPAFLSSMNSYLGIMRHYKSYRLRTKMITKYLHEDWYQYMGIDKRAEKFVSIVRFQNTK